MAHLLLTTDFSPEAERAFGPAVRLAEKLGLRIVLLHVVEDLRAVPHGAPLAPPQSSPEVAEHLREARDRLVAQAAKIPGSEIEVLASPDVARAIVARAHEGGAAFIVMATHGRGGLERLVLGSVVQEVLRHADRPVICYPPPR